jgi:hypothetical protein
VGFGLVKIGFVDGLKTGIGVGIDVVGGFELGVGVETEIGEGDSGFGLGAFI